MSLSYIQAFPLPIHFSYWSQRESFKNVKLDNVPPTLKLQWVLLSLANMQYPYYLCPSVFIHHDVALVCLNSIKLCHSTSCSLNLNSSWSHSGSSNTRCSS